MLTFSIECTICFSGLINGHNFRTFHTRFLVAILLKQSVTYAISCMCMCVDQNLIPP